MKKLWEGFKKVMHAIGRFNSAVILGLMYFTIFLPLHIYGILRDPLNKRGKRGWTTLTFEPDETWIRRQF